MTLLEKIKNYKWFDSPNKLRVILEEMYNSIGVRTAVLTGFTSGAGTVSATDNVLQAIQKLDGNNGLKAPIVHTHTVSQITDFPTFKTIEGQSIIGAGNIDLNVLHKTGDTFLNSTGLDPVLTQDATTLDVKKTNPLNLPVSNSVVGDINSEHFTVLSNFVPTERFNGAYAITNGFTIPNGSTGQNSYFYLSPTTVPIDTRYYFNGSKMVVKFEITYTNFSQLSTTDPLVILQRRQGNTIITLFVNFETLTYTDVDSGANKTRTFTGTYTIKQSDVDNSYWYLPYWKTNNTNMVSSPVSITLNPANSSIKFSNFVKYRIDNLENRNYTIVTVKRNGTVGVDCDYTGRRGIQDAIDAITNASSDRQYIIRASGTFEATQTSHFDKNASGQLSFILLKPYVHLIGLNRDDCIITGKLPNNLGAGFAYSQYQTMRHDINHSRIENVSIVGENLRYPLHIDAGALGNKDFVQTIKNCRIWHKGNTGDALNWTSATALGLGTSDGQLLTLEDCEIKAKLAGAYLHTNQNFSLPSILNLIRCKIITTEGIGEVVVQALGSGVRDKVILNNCNLDAGRIRYDNTPWIPIELSNQRADHAEIELLMTNQQPMSFDNSQMTGKGLKIASKTTGASSTVTFDQTSSAFNLIIGNSLESTAIVNRYNRNQIYGYQYKSGGQSLAGYAIGGLDIGENAVGLNSNFYIGSLGKRLGDCSVVNKTLTVIVNGNTYNIVFNKNYNGTANTVAPNYSNAAIIAEINAVIGAVATVTEYVVGTDYYPQFEGVITMTNADAVEVYSGMGVVFTGNKTFRKALNSDNRLDGICIDEVRVGDEARIITKGELFLAYTGARFRTNEVSNTNHPIGTELGISTTIAGRFDVNAYPKFLRVFRTAEARIIENLSGNDALKANLASPIFTGSVVVPTAVNANEAVNKGQLDAAARPYKVYTAIIQQSGTNAPVATVLENTLGGTVVWSRNTNGVYYGTLTGAFAFNKTVCFATSASANATNKIGIGITNANFVTLRATNSVDVESDGVVGDLSIEIRVYL